MAGYWPLLDQRAEGGTDRRTDGWTNKHTENLPILQDFVPYWGRCPASSYEIRAEPFDALWSVLMIFFIEMYLYYYAGRIHRRKVGEWIYSCPIIGSICSQIYVSKTHKIPH